MGTIRDYFKRLAAASGENQTPEAGAEMPKKKKKKKKVVAGSYNPALRKNYEDMLKEAGNI